MRPALPLLLVSSAMAGSCGGDAAEAFADASFRLRDAADCTDAFSDRPFLRTLKRQRDWSDEDVAGLCARIEEVTSAYVDDATLTTMVVAGTGQLAGDEAQGAYYFGASGYNLTAIREWLEAARASRGVRLCLREARRARRRDKPLEEGFARDCLERRAGAPFPGPLFKVNLAGSTLDTVGDEVAGLAAGLAIFNVPGEGAVVAFLGGGFYGQADPAYGTFIGCGAAMGFDADAETDTGAAAAGTLLCLGAEFKARAPCFLHACAFPATLDRLSCRRTAPSARAPTGEPASKERS